MKDQPRDHNQHKGGTVPPPQSGTSVTPDLPPGASSQETSGKFHHEKRGSSTLTLLSTWLAATMSSRGNCYPPGITRPPTVPACLQRRFRKGDEGMRSRPHGAQRPLR